MVSLDAQSPLAMDNTITTLSNVFLIRSSRAKIRPSTTERTIDSFDVWVGVENDYTNYPMVSVIEIWTKPLARQVL